MEFFGYTIGKSKEEKQKAQVVSFAKPLPEDSIALAEGSFSGQYVDIEGQVKSEQDLITKYRNLALQPEVDTAIDDIVNEAVISDEKEQPVEANLDKVKGVSEGIKKKIIEEFETVVELMNFKHKGYDVFRRWYVDGRIYYHKIMSENPKQDGILELRYIDPRKMKKATVQKSVKTEGSKGQPITLFKQAEEFYVYNDKGFGTMGTTGVKISKDAIAYVNSGVYEYQSNMVLSHLNKALKPYNQLRMLEDSVVIYRLARAPERRVFYIDVGNLPKMKAEQYMREIMTKHKNRLIYDPTTGEVKDDRKFTTMLEDYWIPRREGGRGTEISALTGGGNLGEMEDVNYFRQKLYRCLNVPVSRMESEGQFNLGRATEISRDEVKFSKFIDRLRTKFSDIFNDVLKTQLIAKNIITLDEWDKIRQDIRYDWLRDNFFEELKEREIINDRLNTLQVADNFVGKYFSKEYVMKKILRFNEEEIKEMDEQMEEEGPPEGMGGPDDGQDPGQDGQQKDPGQDVMDQSEFSKPDTGKAAFPTGPDKSPPVKSATVKKGGPTAGKKKGGAKTSKDEKKPGKFFKKPAKPVTDVKNPKISSFKEFKESLVEDKDDDEDPSDSNGS